MDTPAEVRRTLYLLAALVCMGAGASCWALGTPERTAKAALAQAQQRWEGGRPHHYLLTVRLLTMHSGQTLRLEVRDEHIVEGWSGENTTPMPAADVQQFSAFLPVRQLFVAAHEQVATPIQWQEPLIHLFPPLKQWLAPACPYRSRPPVRFAEGLGYPKQIFIGISSCVFDRDGMEVRVDDLQPLP